MGSDLGTKSLCAVPAAPQRSHRGRAPLRPRSSLEKQGLLALTFADPSGYG
jgi:hypothetical protein